MLFNTLEFWCFFVVVSGLFYGLPRRCSRYVLLASSYFFYMWWNPWLVSLIVFSTSLDYVVGRRIAATEESGARKRLLSLSLVANLGLLAFFKYYNFFVESMARLLTLGSDSLALKIILPVGISFYTFQSMSYTIDIYRRRLEPARSFWDFALFVSCFPQLVAGPIVRASAFLPQLEEWSSPKPRQVLEGVHLALLGMVKKVVFADQFALVADQYFANPAQSPGLLSAWTGVLAFSLQIFFDFSGYTDIARGCGKLLGFEFPLNFRRPYLATSITEFWRRWHISLSTWLRDYLYIPLGGSRDGVLRTYRNLFVTMLLGGLWHGASWNFVVWGGFHGVSLAIERMLETVLPAHVRGFLGGTSWCRLLGVCLTFLLVSVSWVFFRSTSLAHSVGIISHLFSGALGESLWNSLHVGLFVAAAIFMVLEERISLLSRLAVSSAWLRIPYYVVLLFCIELLARTDEQIPICLFSVSDFDSPRQSFSWSPPSFVYENVRSSVAKIAESFDRPYSFL